MQLYPIAPIVLPSVGLNEEAPLFVRHEPAEGSFAGGYQEACKYVFDTWFNLFPAKKYYRYCNLGELYLRLNLGGEYAVVVKGVNRNAAFYLDTDILASYKCQGSANIAVPNANKYEGIYFEIFVGEDQNIIFHDSAWCASAPPLRKTVLGIVTCTYKREKYVYHNAGIIESFLQKNPELATRMRFFIVDNGRTIDKGKIGTHNIVIDNINAGGAGGFTRGLIEILCHYPEIDRVIFCDDDVEFIPSAFVKTLLLCDHLKDVYKNSFVNGAMLEQTNKFMFVENLAIQDRLWVRPAIQFRDLVNLRNILDINDINPEVFHNPEYKTDSAWWFHCFSTAVAKTHGMPFPCFFRGDDLEWGWRNYGREHISMNGISIWHMPFLFRVSAPTEYYYLTRNMFFINSIYTENFQEMFPVYFREKFQYLLETWDYISAEIFLAAMEDIIKGDKSFRQPPDVQFKNISMLNKKRDLETASRDEIESALAPLPGPRSWIWRLYSLTRQGRNAPDFLFNGTGYALDFFPPVEKFMFKSSVTVVNPLTRRKEVRKHDATRSRNLETRFEALLAEICANFDSLRDTFQQFHKEFVTMDFWQNYLGMDER